MKGDFTRNTFDPRNHFTRVLMQQGRVQLDADWNEQVGILLHYLQTLAADLIGPHGGSGDSFKIHPCLNAGDEIRDENGELINCADANSDISSYDNDFYIFKGHYYINGILCENKQPIRYSQQVDYPLPESLSDGEYLVYLDVWERHITYIEDNSIREVALGGPDTATRAKIVWQVKTRDLSRVTDCTDFAPAWDDLVKEWQPENRGQLKARAKITEDIDLNDPCITSPEARYRGTENQLYRVEIHTGGTAGKATFKWSRDNGSVIFPIRKLATDSAAGTTTVTVVHLGHDSRFSLQEGDWVEIVDDDYVLQNRAEPLLKVISVNRVDLQVTLEGSPSVYGQNPAKHPLLRRWDHKAGDRRKGGLQLYRGAARIVEGTNDDNWLILEDGIQIQFQSDATYRTGDYWLIPARTTTGDVEWPGPVDNPEVRPPHGVEHHYAPLAIILVDGGGVVSVENDCRYQFEPSGTPVSEQSSRQ